MTFLLIFIAFLITIWVLAHYNFWRPIVPLTHPRILMYHSVNDSALGVPDSLVVKPKAFDRQLAYLSRKGYKFCTISELLESQDNKQRVVLTFDDGFADNFTNVLPILQRYKAKATIYLSPEISGIDKLTQQQITSMQKTGLIEFGAHTLNHVNLSKLDEDSAYNEIHTSKTRVEEMVKEPCKAFAYPFGRFNKQTVELVKKAGLQSSVTVKKGIGPITDRYRIRRVSILRETNMLQFHIALTRGRYRV